MAFLYDIRWWLWVLHERARLHWSASSSTRLTALATDPPSKTCTPSSSTVKVSLLFYLRRTRCTIGSPFPYDFSSTASGLDLRLDILDTGGSYVFPAMRTLAIKSADGFILVCAADDPPSLEVHAISRVALLLFDDFPKKFALPSDY